MARLPVSGTEVVLRPLTGAEDILLLESPAAGTGPHASPDDAALVLALVRRLAQPADGATADWSALVVTDLDALLLYVRQACFGDLLRAETLCPTAGCGARMDVAFRIGDYLAHHVPRRARRVEPDGETGWFRFTDAPIRFRIPTGADQMAVARQPDPARALIARCVCPTPLPARALRRVETALEALAPSLSSDLEGACPECGAAVTVAFDPRRFTLWELRDQGAFVYEDVTLLASCCHWSEAEILALPRSRRIAYAEMIRQQRSPS